MQNMHVNIAEKLSVFEKINFRTCRGYNFLVCTMYICNQCYTDQTALFCICSRRQADVVINFDVAHMSALVLKWCRSVGQ